MSQVQPKEKLKFKIGLSGTYWGKKPQYSISVNDQLFAEGTIAGSSNEVEYIEFYCDVEENQEHCIKVRLLNKDDSDTVESEDKSSIVKDMLLNIHNIEIDDISLEHLLWTASSFVGDDPERPVLKRCVNLGWNGTYNLPFTSPFYLWLLENL